MSDDTKSDNATSYANPELEAFMESLRTIPWFENVGKPISDKSVKQVFSWAEAWKYLQKDSWFNAPFHDHIDQMHPICKEAYIIARDAVTESGNDHELEKGINVSLEAAYTASGAAYEIATDSKDRFFVGLMKWYQKGHWPCGWEGTYPEGRLIVY